MKISKVVLVVTGVVVACRLKGRRGDVVSRKRLDWYPHRERLLLEGQFKRYYRMSADAFDVLVGFLTPLLQRCPAKSVNRTRTKPIEVVNMVQMTISWLAGGSYHTIRVLAGVSTSAFYEILVDVMQAICDHPRFHVKAPLELLPDIEAAASEFSSISSNNILTGSPSSDEVPDVSAFYSGHYLTYGINVQALCDASCKFTGYCFNSPGKVADSVAFTKWKLSASVEKLPFGYYIIGDNAYMLSAHLLVPFTKPEIKTVDHSAYNFYISQLRIRIEMSFGLLVNKWQIFQRPLTVDFVHTGLVIKTAMQLHNYCIDDRINSNRGKSASTAALQEYNALECCSYLQTRDTLSSVADIKVKNGHIVRQVVLEHILDHNMARP
eukprot:jgi/Phyca11/133642/e_gw1.610.1.1